VSECAAKGAHLRIMGRHEAAERHMPHAAVFPRKRPDVRAELRAAERIRPTCSGHLVGEQGQYSSDPHGTRDTFRVLPCLCVSHARDTVGTVVH